MAQQLLFEPGRFPAKHTHPLSPEMLAAREISTLRTTIAKLAAVEGDPPLPLRTARRSS
jgi:hypothetical protein